jgi:hypothetical protein
MVTKEPNHTLRPGQILVNSFGYEQTNVDFYQIVRITAARIFAKPMTKGVAPHGPEYMSGDVVPLDVVETAKEILMKPYVRSRRDEITHWGAKFKGHYCYLWNGKPESCSWYG